MKVEMEFSVENEGNESQKQANQVSSEDRWNEVVCR